MEPTQDEGLSLARAFQAGDASAFDRIAAAYGDRVYRMGLALLGDREEALDLAQEVLLRVHRGLSRFVPAAAFSTWLYGIALNVSREFRRRRLPRLPEGALADPPADPPGVSPVERMAVLEAVRGLPDRQREVVTLRFFQGLSTEETAAALGIPGGTVKSNLFKAMAALREALGEPPEAGASFTSEVG